ncbi:hypothetical protein CRUP_038173 [Coryphaenoides rupestris]|nr:hypothetical protein CRUP_038173 [Coryphaenoides rupestris]
MERNFSAFSAAFSAFTALASRKSRKAEHRGKRAPPDSTGTHSLYTRYQDYEIMFHVSTMLPYTANNMQQHAM